MNPYDKAYELAKALRNSDVFSHLKAARERIENDSATVSMLQDFRTRQWELQSRQLTGQKITDEEQANLEKLSEVVQLNQDVRRYLEAEYQLTQIMMDIHQIIAESVDDAMLPSPFANSQE